jgi:hypothetical protein
MAPAGFGKTWLLMKRIFPELRKMYGSLWWNAAMTGMSGAAIGGNTLHSLAGIKTGAGSAASLAAAIMDSQRVWGR